jgi:spermidine synthase
VALSVPLFGIGLVIAISAKPEKTIGYASLRNKVLYAGAVLVSVPLAAFTHGYESRLRQRVELRDYTATVIASGEGMNRKLYVNGQGMTALTPITKYMAHLPLAFLDKPPKNALVVCFGMGTTFRSMLSWDIDSTAVDLVPSVPKLFGYYHPDGPELLKLPNAHVVADDGRRFIERSVDQYDVITLDPPPPVSTPTTSLLFSREFYSIVKRHLRPGGIVQIWIYVADTRWDHAYPAAAAKAIEDSFPYTRAFVSLDGWGVHVLASNDPITLKDAKTLATRLPQKAATDFVEWGPAKTPEEMFGLVLGQEVTLKSISDADARVPPIQDDHPINEYFFLRSAFGYYR